MRIKDLFTVPENEKVTEKHLHRVLISSVCSILLCMGCLVSTTWAWFAVSLENTGNQIQIAAPAVSLAVDSAPYQGGTLGSGTYALTVTLDKDTVAEKDSFGNTSDVYVILTFVEDTTGTVLHSGYAVLNADVTIFDAGNVTVYPGTTPRITTQVSWLKPDGISPLAGPIVLGTAPVAETTPSTTEATQPAETTQPTEATASTTAPTQATEPVTEATQAGTEPAAETTQAAVSE